MKCIQCKKYMLLNHIWLCDECSLLGCAATQPAADTKHISLDPELIKTLNDFQFDTLPSLMHMWSPCDNDSDYICAFCRNRADTNDGAIEHEEDCEGKKLGRELAKLD